MISRISWGIEIDQPGFGLVILNREGVHNEVNAAANIALNSIVDEFCLTDVAANGIADRIENIDVIFRQGPEYRNDQLQLPLGKLSVGNVISFPGRTDQTINELVLPNTVYLTAESFKEEIENLHCAAKEFSDATAHDEMSSIFEQQIAEFAMDHDRVTTYAIKLAIARRIVKFGILPKEVLNSSSLKETGFNRWFDYISSEYANSPKISSSKLKKLALEKYAVEELAIKNLRNSVWSKIFKSFIPFQAETNQIFYAYYQSKVIRNNGHTLLFNDQLTTRLPDEEVKDALEKIYAPDTFQLRPV